VSDALDPASLGLSPRQETAFAALLGALVADAAAIGFHWLYDTERLAERGGGTPEFHTPNPEDFAGVPGYFAHPGKRAGDLSQYGEGFLAATRALIAGGGSYCVRRHQAAFRATFGPGGSWSGYVDHPTQGTLRNMARGEEAARTAGLAAAEGLEGAPRLVDRVLTAARQAQGEELLKSLGDDFQSPAAQALVAAVDAAWLEASGDQDQQLPALSAVVPLVVAGADDATLEQAVRVTHDDDEAVAWALTAGAAVRDALQGTPPGSVVERVRAAATGAVSERLNEALALEGSAVDVVGKLGRNCTLSNAVPGLLWIASRAESYEVGVRQNVAAGGDSCGRALVLGALLATTRGIGGRDGVPYLWLAQLEELPARVQVCLDLAKCLTE
jgi:ADP-ribosylglycohydrolase